MWIATVHLHAFFKPISKKIFRINDLTRLIYFWEPCFCKRAFLLSIVQLSFIKLFTLYDLNLLNWAKNQIRFLEISLNLITRKLGFQTFPDSLLLLSFIIDELLKLAAMVLEKNNCFCYYLIALCAKVSYAILCALRFS